MSVEPLSLQKPLQKKEQSYIKDMALANCLEPLLNALHWQGDRRHLFDALPYYAHSLTVDNFLHTMEVLHYTHDSFHIKPILLNPAFIPCLFITNTHDVFLILDKEDDDIIILDGLTGKRKKLHQPDQQGTAYIFHPVHANDISPREKINWFGRILKKYSGLFRQLFFISFVLNLLALSIPLFSMAVYNQVIPTGSTSTLIDFTVGILIVLAGSALLQAIQAKIFSYLGMRINNTIGNSVFERLLMLPASYTESASVSAQVSRIRDFDNIREFFSGPLLNLLFELPFVIIFIAAIAILGGSLAFIPIIMIGIYALIFSLLRPWINQAIERASKNASARQELSLEALQHIRSLKYTDAIETWCDRYKVLSANTTFANFRTSLLNSSITIISDALMMLSAVAIVGLGTLKILEGNMTVGALIATMMLIWRVLAPLKALCANQTRLGQIRSSIRQVNSLMMIDMEHDPYILASPLNHFQGHVQFNHVSLRYPNTYDPTLVNVNFTVNPGEVVGITGRNGSGKSTLFNLLLGLYKPQAGTLLIDHQDIRQMDPIELRHAISYVPQKPYVFYGSIAQNLYLVNPNATEEELRHATRRADILDDILALPDGFETILDDQSSVQLPTSFLQRLSLARMYLKKSPLILLDEPGNTLDAKGEQALLNAIQYFRGHASVFIITHRPSHLRLTDKILLLHEGQLILSGQTKQVLSQLPKEFIQ